VATTLPIPPPPIDSASDLTQYERDYILESLTEGQAQEILFKIFGANRAFSAAQLTAAIQALQADLPATVVENLPDFLDESVILRFEENPVTKVVKVTLDRAALRQELAQWERDMVGYPTDGALDYYKRPNNTWGKLDGSTTTNNGPAAINVGITGGDTAQMNVPLTGKATYYDPENDPQASSTHRWLRGLSVSDLNPVVIAGAQSQTYTPTVEDEGKVLAYEAAYTASSGTITGAPTRSSWSAVVAAATAALAPTISSNLIADWNSENMVRPFSGGQADAFGTTTATAVFPTATVTDDHTLTCTIQNLADGKDYLLSLYVAGNLDYVDLFSLAYKDGQYRQTSKQVYRLSTRTKMLDSGGSAIEAAADGYCKLTVKVSGLGVPTLFAVRPRPTAEQTPYGNDGSLKLLLSIGEIKEDGV
jgi:hypothetical protein